MHVMMVGTNHRTAGIALREKLAIPKECIGAVLAALRRLEPVEECAILSTCNRTEVYAVTEEESNQFLRCFLAEQHGIDPAEFDHCLYGAEGERAAEHLMRVSSGLDSMMVGEAQILGQVRDAFDLAREASALGPVLDRLLRTAVTAGKRARSETAIGRGAISVAHAAVSLAERIFGNLDGHGALVLGAGETSALTARLLSKNGASCIIVANRTHARAQSLADELGGRAVYFEDFPAAIADVDVVLCSTAAPHAVVTREMVRRAMASRRGRPLFLIDLAVPRDVEPGVGDIDGVYLYSVDDLEDVVRQNLEERRREATRVEAIIREEAVRFSEWLQGRRAVPVMVALQEKCEEIRRAEIEKMAGRLGHLSERDRELIEILSRGIVKRILKEPLAQLKAGPVDAEPAGESLRLVRRLFALEEVDRGE